MENYLQNVTINSNTYNSVNGEYRKNCWDGHDTLEKYRRLLSYEQGINKYLD